jgi:hypothetical protein
MPNGPMTEAVQYANGTQKLDWSDVMQTADAAETPFLSALRHGKKPVAKEASWPAKKRGAVVGAGVPDNTAVSSYNHQDRTYLKGISQWFRDAWKVSHFADLTESHGVLDEAKEQKAESLIRLRLALEQWFLSTKDCAMEGVGGAAANLTRGVGRWLENDSAQLNTAYAIPDGFRVAAAAKFSAALSTFDDDALEALLIAMSKQRKREVTIDLHAGVSLAASMSAWTQRDPNISASIAAVSQYPRSNPKGYQRMVNTFTFQNGTVRSHTNYNLFVDPDTGAESAQTPLGGYLLDMENGWEVRDMKAIKHTDQADDGSGVGGWWDWTGMLLCLMPCGQGIIYPSGA